MVHFIDFHFASDPVQSDGYHNRTLSGNKGWFFKIIFFLTRARIWFIESDLFFNGQTEIRFIRVFIPKRSKWMIV